MLSTAPTSQTSPEELVFSYLEDNPDSSLASVVDMKHQRKKLEMVAEDILQNFLEPKTYNCEPARTFLREILAGIVLEMTIQSCSKPEFINEWIVYLLEDGEPEFMNAIDAGVGSATGSGATTVDSANAREMEKGHRKRLSRAEEAMEEAMLEARRLSQLIAEEEAKKSEGQHSLIENTSIELPDNQGSSILAQSLAAASIAAPNSSSPRDKPLDSAQGQSAQPAQSTAALASASTFTSFDQIVPLNKPTALHAEQISPTQKSEPSPMTLHNANISIFDDTVASDKSVLRGKPSIDYLIQIEPVLSAHPGWMIVRKYADFETLHEVLRKISTISGAGGFVLKHSELPGWKGQTKPAVSAALEGYLIDALRYQQLAESEKMKKFLEKDQAAGSGSPSAGGKGGFWPKPAAFETMGKGMLDALSSAPKGAAEGGKALFGGVSGVLGGVASLGQKRPTTGSSMGTGKPRNSSSISLPRTDSTPLESSGHRKGRESQDGLRNEPPVVPHSTNTPPVESRIGAAYPGVDRGNPHKSSGRASPPLRTSLNREPSKSSFSQAVLDTPLPWVPGEIEEILNLPPLPPPPSDIRDDYDPVVQTFIHPKESFTTSRLSISTTTSSHSPSPPSPSLTPTPSTTSADTHPTPIPELAPKPTPPRTPSTPLTEEETQITIELLFAIITSLYTLSSAWNIRRTLLTAAKTFLLRPGNPNLEAIRQLLQDSVIEANTSDTGIAGYIRKVRENCLPTEEERKGWPGEMTGVEKERLRARARKLLVERGMPRALVGVMGQAASREALGRVFDCLQVEEVRRAFVFSMLLQGLRAMTQ
jgi:Sorting nexin C terminal/PXA domain